MTNFRYLEVTVILLIATAFMFLGVLVKKPSSIPSETIIPEKQVETHYNGANLQIVLVRGRYYLRTMVDNEWQWLCTHSCATSNCATRITNFCSDFAKADDLVGAQLELLEDFVFRSMSNDPVVDSVLFKN